MSPAGATTEIVTADIGGTNARFALARVAGGRVIGLGEPAVFRTADHASLELAYAAFARSVGRPLPRAAGIAFAGPVDGEVLTLTNSAWRIHPAALPAALGVDRMVLVNDFGAVAHAVTEVGPEHLAHLCGPDRQLPEDGVISVVGPGTGLGVAYVVRREGRVVVVETEGGHIDFAPLDAVEDRILADLRGRFGRVSAERVVSGPALAGIHAALAAIEGRAVPPRDDAELWTTALAGRDALATAALDRFCRVLGAVAGDIALAQGASAVVLAGGIGLRLAGYLPGSGFARRFVAKGRFEGRMAALPVTLITHPQPGLYGAAAAWAARYPDA